MIQSVSFNNITYGTENKLLFTVSNFLKQPSWWTLSAEPVKAPFPHPAVGNLQQLSGTLPFFPNVTLRQSS